MDGREDETLENGESSYHRFLKGDTDGLTELVDAYYDSLVLYLDTILHNIQDAEDCAEETIIVLTTKKPIFRGSSSFKIVFVLAEAGTDGEKRCSAEKEKLIKKGIAIVRDNGMSVDVLINETQICDLLPTEKFYYELFWTR